MRRSAAHLIVVALLLLTCIEWPGVPVLASQGAPSHEPRGQILPVAGHRDDLSTRLPSPVPWGSPRPTPLPTPIPIDPDATPLPGPIGQIPTPTPVSVQSPSLKWPVAGTITTYYSSAHPAVDIAAPCGTPVVAPIAGTLTWAGWKTNGGGIVVEVTAGNVLVSLNHLSGIADVGPAIAAGQLVGWVGTTGNSTGCHLHYGLLVDGAWRNPLP